MANLGNFFKQTLPIMAATVASGIPGPIGAVAQLVSNALGKNVKPDATEIAAAVANATPEQIIELRKADQAHAETMQKMGFDNVAALEKISADDRSDARARQIAIKDRVPAVLAMLITSGFFGILLLVSLHGIRTEVHDLILTLLGSLGAAWLAVVTYYFGSSAGSDRKTELLASSGK